MKFMKMNPQNRLYSRDQVKVATLVIFFTFSEKFQFILQKTEFPQKIILQKTEKTENHENTHFSNTP